MNWKNIWVFIPIIIGWIVGLFLDLRYNYDYPVVYWFIGSVCMLITMTFVIMVGNKSKITHGSKGVNCSLPTTLSKEKTTMKSIMYQCIMLVKLKLAERRFRKELYKPYKPRKEKV